MVQQSYEILNPEQVEELKKVSVLFQYSMVQKPVTSDLMFNNSRAL
jgi:hypothetical protein